MNMNNEIKRRWISLFVENETGILARISGLFAGKLNNIDSLTVGVTEDPTISRMTISLTSDEQTFEQVKKQLNRSVEVIKVIDFTDIPIRMKEILFIKVYNCNDRDKNDIFHMAQTFKFDVVDYDKTTILIESCKNEAKNDHIIELMKKMYGSRIEVVRGGNVAIQSISMPER